MLSGFYSFTQGPRSDITTGDFPLNATAPRITLGNGRSVADPFFNPVLSRAGRRDVDMLAADSVHLVNMRVQKSFRVRRRAAARAQRRRLQPVQQRRGIRLPLERRPVRQLRQSGRASSSRASHSSAHGSCSDRYPRGISMMRVNRLITAASLSILLAATLTAVTAAQQQPAPEQARPGEEGRSRRRRRRRRLARCAVRGFGSAGDSRHTDHRPRLRRDLEGQRSRTATADRAGPARRSSDGTSKG